MKRLDRRNFLLVASVGASGFVLTACGNDPDDTDLNPTMIPNVDGAPPTLAPVASPGGGATEGGAAEEPAGDGAVVELEAQDPYNWSTKELEAAPGQVIRVTNTGLAQHDFTIDELSIMEELPNGEPVDITLPDDLTVGDTYTYYCAVPGHRQNGMEGTLTIVEASAAAPAEEEAPAEGAATDAGAGGPVTLEAQDPYNWSVTELEAAPGQVIQVTNTGLAQHDFTIDELSIMEELPNGEPVDITLPEDLTVGDTYTYYCAVPGHRQNGMEGTLTIVEAGGGEAAASPAEEGGESTPAEEPAAEEESTPSASPAAVAADPNAVTLEATDPYNWSVKNLAAAPGQVIQVTNKGFLEHDFVIDELSINETLAPGEPVNVTLPDNIAVGDTYTYYCSVPGHRENGMEGTLTIVEAGGGGGASASPAASASPVASPAASPGASPVAASGEVVTLEAQDPFSWSATELEASAGQVIQITNTGFLDHDFTIDDLDINEALPGGATVDVTLPDDLVAGDTYDYYCSVPGHRESGMEGTLTIV